MRRLLAAIGVSLALCIISGCREEKPVGMTKIDVKKMPTMMTRNAVSLISDSGITRYKLAAPLWLVYDEAPDPYWTFPEGLYLEKFNPLLQKEATINCDSAHYFSVRKVWRLDGNVDISNTLGERFLTHQLYWDQQQHTVYSDSFIHIEQPNRTLEGYGFQSDERMSTYTIKQVSGIFPASALKKGSQGGQPNNPPSPPSVTDPTPASQSPDQGEEEKKD